MNADATPAGGSSRNVTYCTPEPGVNLLMDLYQPPAVNGLAPAVLYVHGGGWVSGDKADFAGAAFVQELRRQGYFVASINYRLAPAYRFPAQIQDVKCAIRYLRANAEKYRIDPERIGAMGASAGGHLVALLGTSDENAGFDVGEYTEQSSRVQAVVNLFGPADLVRLMHESYRWLGERIFGVSTMDPELIKPFSPATYITPDDPPFLLLHGDRDELVPLDQSEAFYEQLSAVGVPAELVVVKNAGHAFRPVGGQIRPGLMDLALIVERFLEKNLKQ